VTGLATDDDDLGAGLPLAGFLFAGFLGAGFLGAGFVPPLTVDLALGAAAARVGCVGSGLILGAIGAGGTGEPTGALRLRSSTII